MPELRQDIITGNWVVIAKERAMRPSDFSVQSVCATEDLQNCPFCPGNEPMTPLELYAVRPKGSPPNSSDWEVRVIPNKYPAFIESEMFSSSKYNLPKRDSRGLHEVILHSPEHCLDIATLPREKVELVLRVYRIRYYSAGLDPEVKYVHIIVNHGMESGASLEHSHSQLFGMPFVPPLVQQELAGSSWHMKSRGNCIFCDLISLEMEEKERIVLQSDSFLAIAPFASRFPFEVWILPRIHRESFADATDEELEELSSVLKEVLRRYSEGFKNPPYNYFIHSAPTDGSDNSYYHWHIELFPRLTRLGAFELGTQMMINTTTPEVAASYLRGQVLQ